MRTFAIGVAPYAGKHIQVTRYVQTAAGIEIKIEHNANAPSGKQLQWIQTVSSNAGFSVLCGMRTRVDPFGIGGGVNTVSLPSISGGCKADDLLPFYWTAADLTSGMGPGLSDAPSVPTPATRRTWTCFVTALTEAFGNKVRNLVAIAWGYDRMASGDIRVAAARRASPSELADYFAALRRMYPSYTYS